MCERDGMCVCVYEREESVSVCVRASVCARVHEKIFYKENGKVECIFGCV